MEGWFNRHMDFNKIQVLKKYDSRQNFKTSKGE